MAPYLSCSPDLAPLDFVLFGDVKYVLDQAEFPAEEGLLAAIQRVLSDLTGDILMAVFAKWVERTNCIALNENHYY
jgi:hypothetical protein